VESDVTGEPFGHPGDRAAPPLQQLFVLGIREARAGGRQHGRERLGGGLGLVVKEERDAHADLPLDGLLRRHEPRVQRHQLGPRRDEILRVGALAKSLQP
jgi:hypothetical protein